MGLEVMSKLIKKSNFPWLLSNVLDEDTQEPLLDLDQKVVVTLSGVRVGIFSVAEKDWVKSLSAVNFDDVIYEPYVEFSRKIVKELKQQDKCDIVIGNKTKSLNVFSLKINSD
jgi:5'-nucleotidase